MFLADDIFNSPWFWVVIIMVLTSLYVFFDFKKRKENAYDYETAFKYDLTKLIVTFVFLTLPTIIALCVVGGNENIMQYFMIYGVIVTIVLAILRKDPLFRLWWRIPSLSLFGIGGYNRINHYESNDGGNTWQYKDSHVEADGVKLMGIVLGILLGLAKLFLFIVYITCALFVNIGLSFVYIPIFLGLTIYNGIKARA